MHYDLDLPRESRALPHNPLKAIVAPRPIGWISAMNRAGALNLAPYSFFNAVADNMVAFSSSGRKDAMTRDQLTMDLLDIWERDRKTVLFVTHSISEAVLLSDRVVVMTPRPGRIAEVVDVDLPRPRTLETINTPGFGDVARRIRAVLDGTEVKA